MDREVFLCITVNARHQISTVHIVSVGSLNASIVHPREVYKHAIRENAAAILLVHNHPSGETDPSEDDRAITRRLVQVGELVGISVLDHLIVGKESFYSMKQHGDL